MLFSDLREKGEGLSLDAIRAQTNIPDVLEFKRHLLSLCTPKLRILKKSSKGKNIENDDVFSFNEEFTSKFKRIKIPLISAKEIQPEAVSDIVGGEGEGSLPASVEEDRRHLIEATIVRIMKYVYPIFISLIIIFIFFKVQKVSESQ